MSRDSMQLQAGHRQFKTHSQAKARNARNEGDARTPMLFEIEASLSGSTYGDAISTHRRTPKVTKWTIRRRTKIALKRRLSPSVYILVGCCDALFTILGRTSCAER